MPGQELKALKHRVPWQSPPVTALMHPLLLAARLVGELLDVVRPASVEATKVPTLSLSRCSSLSETCRLRHARSDHGAPTTSVHNRATVEGLPHHVVNENETFCRSEGGGVVCGLQSPRTVAFRHERHGN